MRQRILWNTAEVEDGKLTVYLSAPPDEDPRGWEMWGEAFERTLAPADVGIELIRGAIVAQNVADADELAERLDDLIAQANEQFEHIRKSREGDEQARQRGQEAAAARDEQLEARFRQRGGV